MITLGHRDWLFYLWLWSFAIPGTLIYTAAGYVGLGVRWVWRTSLDIKK